MNEHLDLPYHGAFISQKKIKMDCAPFSPIYSDQRHVYDFAKIQYDPFFLLLKAWHWFRLVVVHSKERVASVKVMKPVEKYACGVLFFIVGIAFLQV